MLILRSANSPIGPSAPDDPHHVAIRGLGARPGRAPQEGAWGLYALTCRRGQVHKLDRGLADVTPLMLRARLAP